MRLQRMDPQLRKLLECAYEAWLDSGIDHRALRGSAKVVSPPDSPLNPQTLGQSLVPESSWGTARNAICCCQPEEACLYRDVLSTPLHCLLCGVGHGCHLVDAAVVLAGGRVRGVLRL